MQTSAGQTHVGSGSGVKGAAVESSVIDWLAWLGKGGLHDRMSRREKDEFHLTAHGGSNIVRTKAQLAVLANGDGLDADR